MSDNSMAEQLARRINDQTALIGVVGLGYVGLPLALTFAEAGFRVLGFDNDPAKVVALAENRSYIGHVGAERLAASRDGDCFEPTGSLSRLAEPDAILICVPTPLTENREPDLSFVLSTVESIAERLRPGQLVVLESTTYPGTTEELLLGKLGESRLQCGRDFFLAFSPERENPGDSEHTTSRMPKVVGGVDEESGDLAELLYGAVVPRTVRVSSASVAEASKLTENIFRAVNIALVNELKMIYEPMGIDVWEVLDAAATKPFGFMRFTPGPGLGGHCIPVDPFYLAWKARQHGGEARFIELAGEVNTAMPAYVVGKVEEALQLRGGKLRGSKALVLGLAYKPNVDDPRESPAFEIIDQLLAAGAEVAYHDPHIPTAPEMRSWPNLPRLVSVELEESALAGYDVRWRSRRVCGQLRRLRPRLRPSKSVALPLQDDHGDVRSSRSRARTGHSLSSGVGRLVHRRDAGSRPWSERSVRFPGADVRLRGRRRSRRLRRQ